MKALCVEAQNELFVGWKSGWDRVDMLDDTFSTNAVTRKKEERKNCF